MNYATIDRYCAIEGTICRKNILFRGEWTYFFAYPSQSHWRDRKIQESQLLVASLLGTEYSDWEELNANVALLIGFAIGLGKPVLVLQQTPASPILDLGTVLRPFETESHSEQIVTSWLDQHTQLIVSRHEQQRHREDRQRQADRIRGMYLGHPDALLDNKLPEYFVTTKEYEDALNARRSIFIGRRGTGKSANFQAVRDELKNNREVVVCRNCSR